MKKRFNVTAMQPLLICLVVWIILIHLITTNKVSAQEHNIKNIPYDDVSSGSLYFKNADGYSLALTQHSDYQVNVNGLLARVSFTQTFKNSSNEFLEAVYVFPLVDDAAVDSMVMEVGDRRIIGKIKEKTQAKKLYQKAKAQGKKTSLVSQQRPNLFTTKLANIAPGESIKISLSYIQSVSLNDETFALRIPLTLTPRFVSSQPLITNIQKKERQAVDSYTKTTKINEHGWALDNARVIDASEITPFQTRVKTLDNQESKSQQQSVTLSITLDAALPLLHVQSLHHRISKTQQNKKLLIDLTDKKVLLNQDFVLQWQLAQGNVPKAAFFKQTDTAQTKVGYHYGLLMLMPPKQANAEAINKEVIYIIDTSGSMGGVAIRQAKQSLVTALDLLSNYDSFNIIAFDDDTESLFTLSRPASADNIIQAKQWLSHLEAGGGTNMYPAIAQSLQQSISESCYRQVIFITDGSVGNEDELFTLIEKKLGNTRLHTIGIGSAPNGYFMSQAAKVGRGTYRYIGSLNEVNEQMTKLFSQISNPLMQNINLIWPIEHVEVFPENIPDLYAGQPLLISARWPINDNKQKSPVIKVSGQLASSLWQEQVVVPQIMKKDVSQSSTIDTADSGVAQWWARQKINHLSALHRRSNMENRKELAAQITALALHHHLVSKYTSFIAIEEQVSRKSTTALKSIGIKNLMPKGSTQIVPLANTALGLLGYFYFSLLFTAVALFIRLSCRVDSYKAC